MEVPWSHGSGSGGAVDTLPPWVQVSRPRSQEELCARRFLRLASLPQLQGAVVLYSLSFWQAGVNPVLSLLPILYVFGPALLLKDYQRRAHDRFEQLSAMILALDCVHALHMILLCICQGDAVVSSPLYALVALSRVLVGFTTAEMQWHFALSTLVAAAAGLSSRAWLPAAVAMVLELAVVMTLADGPSDSKETEDDVSPWQLQQHHSMKEVHRLGLSLGRLQHHCLLTQAMQEMDIERERFSGELLASATHGIAELTATVQHASEPVLCMLKSSCATGTKSAGEAERIGRMGESLKDEVAKLMRYKTQAVWGKLQQRAKDRAQELREYAAQQESTLKAALDGLPELAGVAPSQMYELELEAKNSFEQLVQAELSRSLETAAARMDLVYQSARAMEMRISETVEVLLSLLKYFRSKSGDSSGLVSMPPAVCSLQNASRSTSGARSAQPRRSHERISLPVISEKGSKAIASANCSVEQDDMGEDDSADEQTSTSPSASTDTLPSPCFGKVSVLTRPRYSEDRKDSLSTGCGKSLTSSASSGCITHSDASDADTMSEDGDSVTKTMHKIEDIQDPPKKMLGSLVTESATRPNSSASSETSMDATEDLGNESGQEESSSCRSVSTPVPSISSAPAQASPNDEVASSHVAESTAQSRVASDHLQGVRERHPLFATRLCYRTENFCWSWASARDFRSELDALRVWHRASVTQQPPTASSMAARQLTPAAAVSAPKSAGRPVFVPPPPPPSMAKVGERPFLMPSEVVVDLSAISTETIAAAAAERRAQQSSGAAA